MFRRYACSTLLAWLLVVCLMPWAMAQQPDDNMDDLTIPEGTEFKLQLHTALNSKLSKVGDRVMTTLIDPVSVEDTDVLKKGTRIDGHVNEVKEAGRRGKGGYITITFDSIEMPSGQKVAIIGSLTEIFSAQGGTDPDVGVEGELKGGGPSRKGQAMIVGTMGAIGAAGGIAPGIIMTGVGLGAALLIPRGKQAALGVGSLIGMRLDRDVTLTVPISNN
jgi:hypothetical protein